MHAAQPHIRIKLSVYARKHTRRAKARSVRGKGGALLYIPSGSVMQMHRVHAWHGRVPHVRGKCYHIVVHYMHMCCCPPHPIIGRDGSLNWQLIAALQVAIAEVSRSSSRKV